MLHAFTFVVLGFSLDQFTLEQLSLICPCDPVSTAMLPMLTMADAKSALNCAALDE